MNRRRFLAALFSTVALPSVPSILRPSFNLADAHDVFSDAADAQAEAERQLALLSETHYIRLAGTTTIRFPPLPCSRYFLSLICQADGRTVKWETTNLKWPTGGAPALLKQTDA